MRSHITVRVVALGKAEVTCHHCRARIDVEESVEATFNKRINDVAKLHAKCKHTRAAGDACPCIVKRLAERAKKERKRELAHTQVTIEGTQEPT